MKKVSGVVYGPCLTPGVDNTIACVVTPQGTPGGRLGAPWKRERSGAKEEVLAPPKSVYTGSGHGCTGWVGQSGFSFRPIEVKTTPTVVGL